MGALGGEHRLSKGLEASRTAAKPTQAGLVWGAGLGRLSRGVLSGAWGNPEPLK